MGIKTPSENFVVDMESLSYMAMDESAKSSWIMRGVARKSFKCGAENKTDATANANAYDHKTAAEKAATEKAIVSTPERLKMEAGGMATKHSNDAQANHQTTITTTISGIVGDGKCTKAGGKCIVRRSGSKRTSLSWFLDHKRIFFLLATLSSMGTIVLIYFTLSIAEPQPDGNSP